MGEGAPGAQASSLFDAYEKNTFYSRGVETLFINGIMQLLEAAYKKGWEGKRNIYPRGSLASKYYGYGKVDKKKGKSRYGKKWHEKYPNL